MLRKRLKERKKEGENDEVRIGLRQDNHERVLSLFYSRPTRVFVHLVPPCSRCVVGSLALPISRTRFIFSISAGLAKQFPPENKQTNFDIWP